MSGPGQCGICGAFISPGPRGVCKRCGTEWDNGGPAPQPETCCPYCGRGPIVADAHAWHCPHCGRGGR